MSLVGSIIMTVYTRWENKRRDKIYKAPSEYTEEEKKLERDRGDNATFFRYMV